MGIDGRYYIDENCKLQTLTFSVRVVRHGLSNIYMSLKDGFLTISCPLETDFSSSTTQSLLRNIIVSTMRYEAKRYLPVLLKELALRHGFSYNTVKIHNSRSRWGSCTSRKNINLSLSLMLVQRHLVEYVLLHELCHTVEMNHGERFWALMSKVTDGKARALRGELKRFKLELIKA